jgi:transcriptional regulator of heat shock response
MLHGLVREYIRVAEPVSSEYLRKALELAVSAATVRTWLKDLEDDGFVEQPHTSAGRIPTDRGYRFYVERLRLPHREQTDRIEEGPQALVRHLSQTAHAMAIAGLPSGRIEQYGLLELMLQPEGESRYVIQEISSILDHIHDYVEEIASSNNSVRTSVYIGTENPFMFSVHTSMLVRTVEDRRGRQCVVMLIGPKRMPYSRNISLLEQVNAIID